MPAPTHPDLPPRQPMPQPVARPATLPRPVPAVALAGFTPVGLPTGPLDPASEPARGLTPKPAPAAVPGLAFNPALNGAARLARAGTFGDGPAVPPAGAPPAAGHALAQPSLPANARRSLNRCNLPAVILGGLTYQAHPVALEIDGIREFHHRLWGVLDPLPDPVTRAERFVDYMAVHFCLDDLEQAGLSPGRVRKARRNANYLRMVRGWSFDSDGREGAVLKHWVESRFGLRARHHGGRLDGPDEDAYQRYVTEGAHGLYATNALESQLDLLYTFCQYELARQQPGETHLRLYRGINRIDEHEVLSREANGCYKVLLNNLNSFTAERERADEFGDYILSVRVPLAKVFFYNRLLPGMLKGEDEVVVIGGVYEVAISTH